MPKKNTADQGKQKVVAKCDNPYKVETRRLNEQAKRNIEQFPDGFMLQLTKEDFVFGTSRTAMSRFLGASAKDIGAGLCADTELSASPVSILEMLK